eukprot:COSAG01_NODE_4502_length_4970_cov_587.236707_4_plen_214_part_00
MEQQKVDERKKADLRTAALVVKMEQQQADERKKADLRKKALKQDIAYIEVGSGLRVSGKYTHDGKYTPSGWPYYTCTRSNYTCKMSHYWTPSGDCVWAITTPNGAGGQESRIAESPPSTLGAVLDGTWVGIGSGNAGKQVQVTIKSKAQADKEAADKAARDAKEAKAAADAAAKVQAANDKMMKLINDPPERSTFNAKSHWEKIVYTKPSAKG